MRTRDARTQCADSGLLNRTSMTARWLTWMAAAVATLLASSLSAQEARGIFGMIVDDAGRPIAGVDVKLRGKAGETMSAVTDANGQYRIAAVPAALFSVSVSQNGFVPDARLLREAPGATYDFVLYPVEDEELQAKVDKNWKRDLELFDRAMLVADPVNVLTPEDLQEGKFSFTGDLLNLLPGIPKAPARTAARCTQFLLNDFPERSGAAASISQIPTHQLKLVMVRTPGNPMPEAWRPFAYNSGCTVVAAYTL